MSFMRDSSCFLQYTYGSSNRLLKICIPIIDERDFNMLATLLLLFNFYQKCLLESFYMPNEVNRTNFDSEDTFMFIMLFQRYMIF